ncbi:MAG: hypothetical protein WBA57_21725 [Elainellaceae cyanobacterium]
MSAPPVTSPALSPTQPRQIQPGEALIFLHLMKTGGHTLHKLMRHKYDTASRFYYSQRPGRTLADFQALTDDQRDCLRFIHGHLNFGFHDMLGQPCLYMTLLRHPIKRIISLYYFVYYHPSRYDLVNNPPISFQNYLSPERILTDNGQTRKIAGVASNDFPFGGCTSELLDIAKRNLRDRFLMVGITERFDESLVMLRHLVGLNTLLHTRANTNPAKPQSDPLSEADIDLAIAHHQLDLELYEYGNQLLDQQIASLGDSFQRELTLFRNANAQYRVAHADLDQTRNRLKTMRQKTRQIGRHNDELAAELEQHQQTLNLLETSKFWWLWRKFFKP